MQTSVFAKPFKIIFNESFPLKDAFLEPTTATVFSKLQEDKSYKIEIDLLDVDEVVQKASIYVNGKKKSINVRDSKITLDFEKGTEGIFNIYF